MRYFILSLVLSGMLSGSVWAQSDEQKFLSGEVYLPTHADTIALKKLGFCEFEFMGRSGGTVKYQAQWPHHITQSHLPDKVTAVEHHAASRGRRTGSEAWRGQDYTTYPGRDDGYSSDYSYSGGGSDAGSRLCRGGICGGYSPSYLQMTPLQSQLMERYNSGLNYGEYKSKPGQNYMTSSISGGFRGSQLTR